MTPAIQADGLVKTFGETGALDGVSLSVAPGTVLGLLGPNGAGKTTAVRILATLLEPDAGHAAVGRFDVRTQGHRARELIGLTGQYAAVDNKLTGRENLVLIGRLVGLSRRAARERAAELLEQFDLAGAGHRAAHTCSGGMRRRLDSAASLVGRPRILSLLVVGYLLGFRITTSVPSALAMAALILVFALALSWVMVLVGVVLSVTCPRRSAKMP